MSIDEITKAVCNKMFVASFVESDRLYQETKDLFPKIGVLGDVQPCEPYIDTCPFCGSEAEEDREAFPGVIVYWVQCANCMAKSGRNHSPEEAREAWNKRIGDDY